MCVCVYVCVCVCVCVCVYVCVCVCVCFACICVCTAVDCGDPGTPVNGRRNLGGTTLDSRTTYACDEGYRMDGDMEAICLPSGLWSRPLPRCISKWEKKKKEKEKERKKKHCKFNRYPLLLYFFFRA